MVFFKVFDCNSTFPEANLNNTTKIIGFLQNGEYEKGLTTVFEMLEEGVKPNDQTIVFVLLACAKVGALEKGVRVHDYVVSNGFGLKIYYKKGQVNSFVAGDHVHDRSHEIHLKLDEITKSAREHGYMPETEWVLHNI
ncbi:Pentatricopeptide repeat-containing protein [Artemisia annua]|uniref:Pentatricopeptide repeat-containing protein n=1 Tax=Artemisia annua TaxID=35608 RepID=A0A2U1QCR8_ARTAN|nr:Pentatricopeptide repeat-containing protein [Artemisia annua]